MDARSQLESIVDSLPLFHGERRRLRGELLSHWEDLCRELSSDPSVTGDPGAEALERLGLTDAWRKETVASILAQRTRKEIDMHRIGTGILAVVVIVAVATVGHLVQRVNDLEDRMAAPNPSANQPISRIYDVRDLDLVLSDFPPPRLGVSGEQPDLVAVDAPLSTHDAAAEGVANLHDALRRSGEEGGTLAWGGGRLVAVLSEPGHAVVEATLKAMRASRQKPIIHVQCELHTLNLKENGTLSGSRNPLRFESIDAARVWLSARAGSEPEIRGRLTMNDGQLASLVFMNQRAFVRDWRRTPTVPSVWYPEIGTLSTGTTVGVRAHRDARRDRIEVEIRLQDCREVASRTLAVRREGRSLDVEVPTVLLTTHEKTLDLPHGGAAVAPLSSEADGEAPPTEGTRCLLVSVTVLDPEEVRQRVFGE